MNAVMGETEMDPLSLLLDTGFLRFSSPTGCEGLAKELEGALVILAVRATEPGTGQFRNFIRQAKAQYEAVVILDVINTDLRPVLARYQFVPSVELFDGELLEVFRWRKGELDALGNRAC